ncbi:MAG: hypothetical protein WD055_02690 [Candidatus Dependentiae bacterium]
MLRIIFLSFLLFFGNISLLHANTIDTDIFYVDEKTEEMVKNGEAVYLISPSTQELVDNEWRDVYYKAGLAIFAVYAGIIVLDIVGEIITNTK